MPARRDTQIEASRVRRLSPLQTVEDQSRVWGICCHSCTEREGLAPSWRTELQSTSLCDLPENRSSLSINGSHLRRWGMKPTVLNRRNFSILWVLALVHRGPHAVRCAAIVACRADVYQTRS